ncbi:MAG: DUF2807 domain-containing protein [Archangium sp.]|nr:DUF2807 domain-containing protein [Archangium sp.]
MNTIRSVALASFAAVFVSGCYNYIDGGPQVSETRTVEGFDALRVDDGFKVTWVKGAPQVVVDAPEKALEYLDTKVKNGRLTIELRNGVRVTNFDTIIITASSESIDTFEANGGSSIIAKDLSSNPLRVTASGGSDIEVTGASAELRVNASGGSGVNAAAFAAEEVSIDASGGSTVAIQALKSVVGTASGGSTVTVTGGGDVSKFSTSGGSTLN